MICKIRFAHRFWIGTVIFELGMASLAINAQSTENKFAGNGVAVTQSTARKYAGPATEIDAKLSTLRTALSRSPSDPVLQNNIAVYYYRLGRLDDALRSSLRSVSLDGSSAEARLNLAVIYDRQGLEEKALSEAAAAAALDPKNSRARSYVCELELSMERFVKAEACYRALLREFTPSFDFQLRFGVALFKTKRFNEAQETLEALSRDNPGNISVMNAIANLHFAKKEYKKSVELFKHAVEIDPENARLRFNLGMAYLALNNRPGAVSQYKLIKETDAVLAGSLYKALFGKYIIDARGR